MDLDIQSQEITLKSRKLKTRFSAFVPIYTADTHQKITEVNQLKLGMTVTAGGTVCTVIQGKNGLCLECETYFHFIRYDEEDKFWVSYLACNKDLCDLE